MQFFLVQILHNFTHILRVLPPSNQQSIVRRNHNEILHTNRGNKFSRCMYIVTQESKTNRLSP